MDILNGVEYQHYWMEGKYNTLHKLNEKDMMVTIWFIIHIINLLMVFMLSQGWRNKRVEYDMDLVDSTVKSLRSLANERCETYMESIFFFF